MAKFMQEHDKIEDNLVMEALPQASEPPADPEIKSEVKKCLFEESTPAHDFIKEDDDEAGPSVKPEQVKPEANTTEKLEPKPEPERTGYTPSTKKVGIKS